MTGRLLGLTASLGVALAAPAAQAARPDTDGEPWSFEPDDVLAYVDSPTGAVRVHFAISGPSTTVLTDSDASGAPDLPEALAATAEDVLAAYADLGFRPPVSEAALGIDSLGGSPAIDIYMVEFGGTGDGRFAIDQCAGGVCAGHLLTDNDFAESYYSDAAEAARVLTSHELFHGVQAAYAADLPTWMSEGTATWAEHLFDPETDDYLGFCGAYLAEPTRSINSPPAGTVTAWEYGTALFFGFLQERHGDFVGPMLLEAMEASDEDEGLEAIEVVLTDLGDSFEQAWPVFAAWNLATGRRAGGTSEGYPYARDLRMPPLEVGADGPLVDDDNRFYPLATTYFAVDHPGGELALAFADDPTGLVFSLHRVSAGGDDGTVLDAELILEPNGASSVNLGEHAAGVWILAGSYPQRAPESTKVHFCFGSPEGVQACAVEDDPGDSGDTGAWPGEGDDVADTPEVEDGGCGCATGGSPMGALGLVALVGLALSRRRER